MLRSGTIANRFAAYQVANGGRNFRLPSAIGIATSSARVGRADQHQADTEVEDQRTLGPLQGDDDVAVVGRAGWAARSSRLSWAGALPFGYCRSPKSLVG
ncbi:hypothetical protein MMAN_31660 [Mycobacterium mantenii]|uniref:Uncharacterized protein n=1 Tax=Mycobacterium mantenii TaxID=560555 RepID=A0ABM7JTY0_MYCNT|nr:hypothetical protein MMAN_31660 [Mycobacterium mantenii]